MSTQFDEVVSIMRQRRTADSVLIQAMIENRDRYNADVVVPLPDVSSMPAANRPGPNFFQEAIDGHARSANNSLPKIVCPVHRPELETSQKRADTRQGALYSGWYEDQVQIKLARSYRHLAAYGTHAMVVLADEVHQRASIQIRDPLTAYPELRAADDIRPPKDCGFLFARSAQWIKQNYPGAPEYLAQSSAQGWDTLWDIVEWIDEDCIIIGVMGPRFPAYGYADARPYGYNAIELDRWSNKAGMVPVIAPRRATLDRIMGQLTAMINYSDLFGRMLALQLVASEKAIFPDMVVMSRNGMVPELVGGVWQDGRSGNVNVVVDGVVEVVGKEPGPGTIPMLQLIDQHIRGTAGASPLFGGNAAGMRTGAGVDALGDYGVNPMVAESQRIMERSLVEANRAKIAIEKGYFGKKVFTCILGLSGSDKTVTYTPEKDFDSDMNVVYYPSPGADENKLAVAVTQLAATEIMSRHTARALHPMINDPEGEEDYVNLEKMQDAFVAGLAQEIVQGTTSAAVTAHTITLMEGGMTPWAALIRAQAQLASAGPAPGEPGGAPPVGPPGGSAPGGKIAPGLAGLLAAQGAGPQSAPGATVPNANPDLMNLRHVIQGVNEQMSPGAT